jgi:small subunit ribosomal protein S13
LARIAGVDLPREKRIEYALCYIYGLGLSSAKAIVAEAGVDPATRVRDLTESEISDLRKVIESSYRVEGDLRRELTMSIRRLMEIGSYRGLRHRRGLPVRGQRTKTNARMRKGPKKTVGVRRKKT